MGDLVVGARSGAGEPEREDAEVPPRDDMADRVGSSGGTPPGSGAAFGPGASPAQGAAAGRGAVPADAVPVDGVPGSGSPGSASGNGVSGSGNSVPGASGVRGNGVAYGAPGTGMPENGMPYGAGGESPYSPGASVPPPAQEPPFGNDAPSPGGRGAHRADPAGPGGPGGPGSGDDEASGDGAGHGSKQRSFWKELPLLVGIALVLALLIKTFLLQAFSIPSDSMQHTLERGDRVLVDKLTPWFGSKPTRGEVVVFQDPGGWLPENPPASSNPLVRGLQTSLSFIGLMPSADEKDLIKRVIGVGGDTVECKGTGPVRVNGKALNEPYVFAGNTPCSPDAPFKVTVPKNRIWVMGDHRQDSLDSRFHRSLPGGGTVSDSDVVGRAITVAWPINRWTWLGIPSTFSQPGINAAGTAVPAAVGLAGALPLVLLRRRRLLRRNAAPGTEG